MTTASVAGPLVRFRPGLLNGLDDMPRDVLASEIKVGIPTLRRYVTGETVPAHRTTFATFADLLGCNMLDLVETETGEPLEDEPCPAWCDDHCLVTVRAPVPGFVEVLRSEHRGRENRLGVLTTTVEEIAGHGYIRAKSDYGSDDKSLSVWIGGLTGDDVRWVAAEMVRLAELLDRET